MRDIICTRWVNPKEITSISNWGDTGVKARIPDIQVGTVWKLKGMQKSKGTATLYTREDRGIYLAGGKFFNQPYTFKIPIDILKRSFCYIEIIE